VRELSVDSLRATWHQLARRNDWQLVADEAMFLAQVAAELTALGGDSTQGERVRLAIERTYSGLLYQGLAERQERAAYELWLAFPRLSYRRGWTQPEAEEIAQETMARVLAKQPTLRSPQSMLAWSLTVLRTVQRERHQQPSTPELLPHPAADDDEPREPADLTNMAAQVEQALVNQDLMRLLAQLLPDTLERLVILRVVGRGDKPSDVARDLGLPLHRTRLAKSRALQRLRQDAQLLAMLESLSGDAAPGSTAEGA